jgi:hypothetical protein
LYTIITDGTPINTKVMGPDGKEIRNLSRLDIYIDANGPLEGNTFNLVLDGRISPEPSLEDIQRENQKKESHFISGFSFTMENSPAEDVPLPENKIPVYPPPRTPEELVQEAVDRAEKHNRVIRNDAPFPDTFTGIPSERVYKFLVQKEKTGPVDKFIRIDSPVSPPRFVRVEEERTMETDPNIEISEKAAELVELIRELVKEDRSILHDKNLFKDF